MQRGLRVDRLLRHPVHLDAARGLRVVMQERQRQGQPVRIGAFKTGAADHDVEPVLADIGPDAVPQQFDGALVAVARQHAGAAELEKARIGMTLDQAGDIELVLAVEAAVPFRHVLPQQAVGADHRQLAADRRSGGVVDDSMKYWAAGKALYDPGKITVPTLLLHAEWDADLLSYLAQGYFAQLKNTPYKRLIELSEGTHTVMMEKNRMQFFHELMGFLDEERPLALK